MTTAKQTPNYFQATVMRILSLSQVFVHFDHMFPYVGCLWEVINNQFVLGALLYNINKSNGPKTGTLALHPFLVGYEMRITR